MSQCGGFNGSFFLPRSWVPMIQFDGRAYFSNGWKNHQLQNLIFRPSQVTRLYWHLPTLPPDKTYRCATGLADYGWRWERWVAPNSNGSQIQKNTIFYTMDSNILGRIYDVFKTVHVKMQVICTCILTKWYQKKHPNGLAGTVEARFETNTSVHWRLGWRSESNWGEKNPCCFDVGSPTYIVYKFTFSIICSAYDN